jgi:protein arginine N-methyltransferase 3
MRTEVAKGNLKPEVSTTDTFLDDKYLQPVIEDDALLFSLDDVDSFESDPKAVLDKSDNVAAENTTNGDSSSRIKELEEQLAKVNSQFVEYREFVQQTIDKRWQENEATLPVPKQSEQDRAKEGETSYFDSYSYNGKLHNRLSTPDPHH